MCCEFHNACLESWRGTYLWWREHHPEDPLPRELSQTYIDRAKMFTDVRADLPEREALSVNVRRGVLRRFDRATGSFYRRCAEGRKPGFPRFKPRRWWRLRVEGVPQVRFSDKGDRLAEALGNRGKAVELRVVRAPLRTEVHVVVKHSPRSSR